MRRARGLGLAEVMVSLAIMSILMIGLVQLYGVSFRAYSIGTSHLRLQQRARTIMQRIALDVRSAVRPGIVGEPVEAPALNATGTEIVFFRPDGDFSTFDTRAPKFRKWHLAWDPTTSRLVEEKRNDLDNDWTLVTDLQTGLSNANDLEALSIQGLSFSRPEATTIRISLSLRTQVQTAAGRRSNEDYTLVSDVPIPYYTLSH